MPEYSVLITVVVGIFSAGVTWGIMSARQRASSTKIDALLADLKTVVSDLRGLATDVKVMSALSSRVEDQLHAHSEKISSLETAVAKLQAQAA